MKNVQNTSLGIIGCGNVATEILKSNLENVKNIFIYDIDKEKSSLLAEHFTKYRPIICSSIKDIVKFAGVIVETASINAVGDILTEIFSQKQVKKNVVILSVGGLIKNYNLYKKLVMEGYKIHIPSGAIAGCDALSAVKCCRIQKIFLKTTKPTKTLLSASYFTTHKLIYDRMLKNKKVSVFKGSVYEAIKYFPRNINVAATLAIVSEQPKKVKVEIVADKSIDKNIHEVTILSSVGKIYTRTENVPSPNNPKTSYLAALSVISVLKNLLRSE